MSCFLITGGAGFFGSILKKELLAKGHKCVSIDLCPDPDKHENLTSILGDIRDKELVEKIFSENQFDAVFHMAAMLAHDRKRINNLWTSNVDGTEIIADACIRHISTTPSPKQKNPTPSRFTASPSWKGKRFSSPARTS